MDSEKLSKFVKLPTFDGDEEKFQLWLVRFEAYATCCRFRAVVGDAKEAELPRQILVLVLGETAFAFEALATAAHAFKFCRRHGG